jgi:hypothetical protein
MDWQFLRNSSLHRPLPERRHLLCSQHLRLYRYWISGCYLHCSRLLLRLPERWSLLCPQHLYLHLVMDWHRLPDPRFSLSLQISFPFFNGLSLPNCLPKVLSKKSFLSGETTPFV